MARKGRPSARESLIAWRSWLDIPTRLDTARPATGMLAADCTRFSCFSREMVARSVRMIVGEQSSMIARSFCATLAVAGG